MKSQATHQNFKNWETRSLKLDMPIQMSEKAVFVKGQIVRGGVWFPLSCINVVDDFEIEIPLWMLAKKGLNFLA